MSNKNKNTMKAQNNIISHSKALDFMAAGKAIMTIESKASHKHFTFKFVTPKLDEENSSELKKGKDRPIWVRLLNGADNTTSYAFMGTIFGDKYYHSKKSYIGEDAQAVQSFKWWFQSLIAADESRLNKIELYHEGRCMKCGHKLTTPTSVEQGVGPVCADWIERQKIIRDKKIRHVIQLCDDVSTKEATDAIDFLDGFYKGTDGMWS